MVRGPTLRIGAAGASVGQYFFVPTSQALSYGQDKTNPSKEGCGEPYAADCAGYS